MPWRKAAFNTVSPSSTSISMPNGSKRTVWTIAPGIPRPRNYAFAQDDSAMRRASKKGVAEATPRPISVAGVDDVTLAIFGDRRVALFRRQRAEAAQRTAEHVAA